MLAALDSGSRARIRPWQKLAQINWSMVLLVCLIASVGFVMLYSAAGGSLDP
jgi:rod shape determining protein RodA